MKIGFTGIELPEGKSKYKDEKLIALEKKDKPKKVSPFFVEFICDEFIQTEAIVVSEDKVLDLLILDMEKVDGRLERAIDDNEKVVLNKCMENLENEIPLCDVEFSEAENEIVKAAAFYSCKPVVIVKDDLDLNTIITMALKKADNMFFYTSGPKESHAWLVKKNSDIVTCAGKIHSDLARGFIRGDVVKFDDYLNCHNFNECKSKGFAKVVEKDYIVQPDEIIEIRFNV
jgi:ribosome-binding ATPase